MRERLADQRALLDPQLEALLAFQPLPFAALTPSRVPQAGGVYLVSATINGVELPYYVGQSSNLSERLYRNHLMGPTSNARLKRYLCASRECPDEDGAKLFILAACAARWVLQERRRERGILEAYVTAMLAPKYAISVLEAQ